MTTKNFFIKISDNANVEIVKYHVRVSEKLIFTTAAIFAIAVMAKFFQSAAKIILTKNTEQNRPLAGSANLNEFAKTGERSITPAFNISSEILSQVTPHKRSQTIHIFCEIEAEKFLNDNRNLLFTVFFVLFSKMALFS